MKRRSTTKRKNNRKRSINRFRLFVVLSLANVVLVVAILLMLPTAFQTTDEKTGETKQWLGVENITVEGNTAIIDGVEQYTGAHLSSPDLRAGAALVLAGLVAEGQTEISEIYHIERGYEKFIEKFKALGADIARIDD